MASFAAPTAAASAAAPSKDWRDDCVKPPKDTRVQTLVCYSFTFLPTCSPKEERSGKSISPHLCHVYIKHILNL